jgi:acetylornithine deacetylase/succinyl-diaminopimelate desuccinylase-like protein
MMALARLLTTLHDEAGNVAVVGVSSFVWDGAGLSEEEFRTGADLLEGVRLTGSGPVGARLWSKPSITAIGVDMTSVAGSSNVLIPEVRAKLSMRIVPGSDPERELDALVAHLESHAPWGARVEVERVDAASPFHCSTDGPGYAAARLALEDAYGAPPGEAGSGGSIPLLQTLQRAAPNAEFILWGPEDMAAARIHASDESVDPSEIEQMILAQAFLLQRLAEGTESRA